MEGWPTTSDDPKLQLLHLNIDDQQQTIEMGKITFDKPGEYDVTLRPADPGNWKAVNVWKLQLAAAK